MVLFLHYLMLYFSGSLLHLFYKSLCYGNHVKVHCPIQFTVLVPVTGSLGSAHLFFLVVDLRLFHYLFLQYH